MVRSELSVALTVSRRVATTRVAPGSEVASIRYRGPFRPTEPMVWAAESG